MGCARDHCWRGAGWIVLAQFLDTSAILVNLGSQRHVELGVGFRGCVCLQQLYALLVQRNGMVDVAGIVCRDGVLDALDSMRTGIR